MAFSDLKKYVDNADVLTDEMKLNLIKTIGALSEADQIALRARMETLQNTDLSALINALDSATLKYVKGDEP